MAKKAVSLKKEGQLGEAADLMEEAFNKWPELRDKFAHQVKLWRCGVSVWSASPQTESSECRPLLEVANADLYDGNSFRITGLRADATAREISRQVDALKYLEELGQVSATRTAAFSPNSPPSVERIQGGHRPPKGPGASPHR